jgi:hypothetical protein
VLGNTTAAGTGVALPVSGKAVVYCDGTNVVNITDLAKMSGIVPAANGGTGVNNGAFLYTLPGLTCNIPAQQLVMTTKNAAYGFVLADAGGGFLHTEVTARIWTIPANASVAYPVGTMITCVNGNGAGIITVAITSDTMRLAVAGTSGSRTLAANGIATFLKIASTEWLASGAGLT